MEKYYIYKLTNKINGLIYIGQSINPEKRLKEHISAKNKNTYIDKAIRKYEINNFEFEIIDEAYNQDDIDNLEKKYIKEFNTLKPNGYNILKGGRKQQGTWNFKPINEYDLEGNFIATYESASYYSNFVNKEYLSRGIRASCQKHTKYKDRIFRYVGDEKPKKYIKPSSNRKIPIYQFDLKGNLLNKFNSIKEASEITKSSRTAIIGCINGRYKTANNYLWSKNDKIYVEKSPKIIKKNMIYQCDEDKIITNVFYNAVEAEKINDYKKNSNKLILKHIDTNKLYRGYYWYHIKYYEDNIVPSLEIGRCND